MSLAAEYNATRIWILNVGDFKANEIPAEFFLSMVRQLGHIHLRTEANEFIGLQRNRFVRLHLCS